MFLQDAQTDEDINKFANSSIDDILAQRTETITHDDKEKSNDPDAAMFSEAVFVAHEDDTNVNIDDENFWEALGVGNEEEVQEMYTSPFMRRRRTRLQSKNAHNNNNGGYDSEGYSMDDGSMSHVDDGASLLGALSYIIYGKWQQIYDDLTTEEKVYLKLVKEESDLPCLNRLRVTLKSKKKVWLRLKLKGGENGAEEEKKSNDTPSAPNTDSKPKKKKANHGVSGPAKMGLAHADIRRVLECMPGALQCTNYKFKYRLDRDESWTSKKAFKKSLKIKKEDWPKFSPLEEQLFITEIVHILNVCVRHPNIKQSDPAFATITIAVLNQFVQCMISPHHQVAERSLMVWRDETVRICVDLHREKIWPNIYRALQHNKEKYWLSAIRNINRQIMSDFKRSSSRKT